MTPALKRRAAKSALTGDAHFAHRPRNRQSGDSMLISRYAAVAAALLSLCAGAVHSGAALAAPPMPAEDRFLPYFGDLPPCGDGWTLQKITDDFNYHQYWYSNARLELAQFEAVREIGYRTNGDEFIPRRYCIARALFSDGRRREVKYNTVERGGFIGIGDGVEWCVVGLDPLHVYSPACRAAGP
jgi:hypothetical protein